MDTSILIMAAVMVALFVIPVYLFVRSHNKNKNKNDTTN